MTLQTSDSEVQIETMRFFYSWTQNVQLVKIKPLEKEWPADPRSCASYLVICKFAVTSESFRF